MAALRCEREFFKVSAESLAPLLLGCMLVRYVESGMCMRGRIVETEAYVGLEDRASHAFGGRRSLRNESMYAREGTAYVYFTYGMHHCFNVVCGEIGVPEAVLIRALEPLGDLQPWRERRRADDRARRVPLNDRDLARGPGRLCQAMGIDRALDGEDLTTSPRVWIERPAAELSGFEIARGPRIGIGEKGEWTARPLRFWIQGSRYAS